ncbi:hypothetical protein AMTR_s00002p00159860 [Amborella trichopoda]|uniref:Peptidase S8/S53 domain-containing protein n=1 Tax=Amborella trichopoda TaxID=13333 RepID=W1P0H1_AMBTC|nr:hypothetical protein AMTR_s00002p00159860 [Amborella trichopoda]
MLQSTKGVRLIHEDCKVSKATTHTPEFMGIPISVWPQFGGAQDSGKGVVIGMIDTGVNPSHPSFSTGNTTSNSSNHGHETTSTRKMITSASNMNHETSSDISGTNMSHGFRGRCEIGEGFPESTCSGKIVGARYFARAAIAAGDFNATRDYASPFDADGHGR